MLEVTLNQEMAPLACSNVGSLHFANGQSIIVAMLPRAKLPIPYQPAMQPHDNGYITWPSDEFTLLELRHPTNEIASSSHMFLSVAQVAF